MQNEQRPKTSDDIAQAEVHKKLGELSERLQKEKRRKGFWQILSVALLCILTYQKKSNVVWLPVADSQQLCVVVSDWWDLKVQAYYPVWRKPTGDTREYSEQWCIKYADDSWRVFYDGRGKKPAYTYPLVTYSTYF